MTFLHPWFLWGLAALAVPVALHLMNRQLAIPVRFPSLRFLRSAHLPREGRRRLQDLLLLLLRLLALAAGVLAFSKPQLPREAGAAAASRQAEVILVADLSASMQGWEAMPRLRAAAETCLRDRPAAEVGLVTFDNQVRLRLAPGTERAVIQQALREAQPGYCAGEPGRALRAALGLFRPGFQHTLIVLSDFQLSDWQAPDLPAMPPGVAIELVNVNPGRGGNCGITAARVTPLPGGAVRLAATVRNWGQGAVTQTLEVKAGTGTQSKPLSLPPLQTREAVFVIKDAGTQQAELLLQADPYPADNRAVVWLGRPPARKLLAVVPAEAEPQRQAELLFLRKALETGTDGQPPEYELDSVTPEVLASLKLRDIPVLFLLGAAGYFRDAEWQACRKYVEAGGVIISTPGATAAQQFFGLKQQGLLNADFAGLAAADGRRESPFAVGQINPDSPIGALMADATNKDLLIFPIYKYARLKVPGLAKVLLAANGSGDPLLLEQPLGQGRVLVFAFSFDLAWSEFPMTTAFVPVLREQLRQVAPPRHGAQRLECGQPVPGAPVPGAAVAAVVTAAPVATYDTSKPGVLMVDRTPYEVNVPARESVVENVDPDVLRRTFAPAAGVVTAGSATGAALADTGRPPPVELWPACALAAAGLIVLELLLAAWLDSRRVSQRVGTAGATGRECSVP